MATESELRQEIAGERQQLADAVESLREELNETAERGKRIGVIVGTAAGAIFVAKKILRRRHRDD
jgi:glutamine amidotransferase PdxT